MQIRFSLIQLLPYGLWYSGTILGILGVHELGHYLACRYYRVDASLPYFLPAPLLLTGTLGAFIRIREPIPTKAILFDIGVAGPFAGFAIALPALLLGLSLSRMVPLPARFLALSSWESRCSSERQRGCCGDRRRRLLAEPPSDGIRGVVRRARDGAQSDSHRAARWRPHRLCRARSPIIVRHGGLAPGGDGTHLRFSNSWIVWTSLMVVMLFIYGPHHPRTLDEEVPLDTRRLWLALLALIILAVCFTPTPIEPIELIRPGRS